MKKIRLKKLILPSLNAAAIAGIIVLTAAGSGMARTQKYNYTAEKWRGESRDSYYQMSCFFSDDSGMDTSRMRSVRGQIMTALKKAAYDTGSGNRLFTDAYSTDAGSAKVKCDISRRADADIIAVGGDFFYFHSFELVSGAYFTEEDTMQDGAVIDRELAWELYGSDDIAGKNIYINGVKCYISGVVENPEDKASKKCMKDVMRAYVSYDTAAAMAAGSSLSDFAGIEEDTSSKRISCYECVLPEPVENFASKTVKEIFEQNYKGSVRFTGNTERFDPVRREKSFKKIADSVIHDDGIKLPFWENSSRIAEYKLSWIYAARHILITVPLFTLIWLGYRLIRLYSRNKTRLKQSISDGISRFITNHRKNSAEKTETR